MIAEYFRQQTAELSAACLADIHTLDQWKAGRDLLRQQLLEMLGLDPLPERTDLKAVVTGRTERGEIQGKHHGTYSEGTRWWANRGYTPAGVEAWNCVRALDYLQTRPEVDPRRVGATGRSGGGAYSWV